MRRVWEFLGLPLQINNLSAGGLGGCPAAACDPEGQNPSGEAGGGWVQPLRCPSREVGAGCWQVMRSKGSSHGTGAVSPLLITSCGGLSQFFSQHLCCWGWEAGIRASFPRPRRSHLGFCPSVAPRLTLPAASPSRGGGTRGCCALAAWTADAAAAKMATRGR